MAIQLIDALTSPGDGPGSWLDQLKDGLAQCGLAAPALSHQTQGFPLGNRQTDLVDGVDLGMNSTEDAAMDSVMLGQTPYLEQRRRFRRGTRLGAFRSGRHGVVSRTIRSDSQHAARWPGAFSSSG